jgi:hypothetical protein
MCEIEIKDEIVPADVEKEASEVVRKLVPQKSRTTDEKVL